MKKTYKDTPRNQGRISRYVLDDMNRLDICWRPYICVDGLYYPCAMEVELWSATCPLIFYDYVEWHYPHRVTRQFGYLQGIPLTPRRNAHTVVDHVLGLDYVMIHEDAITQ